MKQIVLAREPAEPAFEKAQPGPLRAERQRRAVLLPVIVERPLIAFEHGPRDLRHVLDAALLAPVKEIADANAIAVERIRGEVLHPHPRDVTLDQRVHAVRGRGGRRRFRHSAAGHFPPLRLHCNYVGAVIFRSPVDVSFCAQQAEKRLEGLSLLG